MYKPIIGIVGRIEKVDNNLYNRNVMSTTEDYRRAICLSQGIPILIMPTEIIEFCKFKEENFESEKLDEKVKNDIIRQIKLCDGILLPGGCKIFEYDKFICKFALDNDIPILGICLGMEIMASVDCNNEKVISKIANGVNHKKMDTFAHNINIDENSKLFSIVKSNKFQVNSRHICHITKTNKFEKVGFSDDNIIEAIELKNNRFAIGVQWHPESIYEKSIQAKRIFDEFIRVSSKK